MAEHDGGMASGDKAGREVELKLKVDDLAALMKVAAVAVRDMQGVVHPTVTQTNAFFDTPDRALGARGLVLRVREERAKAGAKWFVTAKGPGQRSGNLTDVLEEEVEIDEARAKAILKGTKGGERADPIACLEGGPASRQNIVSFLRNTLAGRPIVLIGSFLNERTRVDVTLGDASTGAAFTAVLELDRTRFPPRDGVEQVHHEVEMEVPAGVDPAHASRLLDDLFARAGVAGRHAPGKARRFFAALRGERLDA